MSKFISAILATLALLVLSVSPALASHYWKLEFATPQSLTNDATFNLEFKTLSTVASDDITVEAFQNGSSIGSVTTTKDYGDSGFIPVSLPSDGTYSFSLVATNSNGSEVKNSVTKQVTLDSHAPGTPTFNGSSQNGTSFTISATAANDDTTLIRVYSSTSTNFVANSSTLVEEVAVSGGQTISRTYNTGSTTKRYYAVQAFDAVGNASGLSGDENVVVTQTTAPGGVGGSNAAITTANTGTGGGTATAGEGTVLGETDETSGQNGDVLGAEDASGNATDGQSSPSEIVAETSDSSTPIVIGGIIVALLLLAYTFRGSIRRLVAREDTL